MNYEEEENAPGIGTLGDHENNLQNIYNESPSLPTSTF